MSRSLREELVPRRRAQMMTRVGWKRSGSSVACCGRRTETEGGRRGRRQIAAPSCCRMDRVNTCRAWLAKRRPISHSFIKSEPERSSEVLTTFPASRDYRSMSVEMC